ncbi:phosphotransferase [Agarilytica rhodophyticola]|uniref:phosphotransferase n=1 Tax=Agarilytica rhodophyticola TaxID=1737490 RepID=UPI000B3490AC|nr:phosphotransferase [Agarilytica rhodophyticola]
MSEKSLPGLNLIIENILSRKLGVHSLVRIETLQSLWSGYGEILRCIVSGCETDTFIVKHIKVPDNVDHPRGWNSDISHKRKMHSYQVEGNWYRYWVPSESLHEEVNQQLNCRVPKSFFIQSNNSEFLFILEDLDAAGYSRRIAQASLPQIHLCLRWLANFHAKFMGQQADKNSNDTLWPVGTYWHLATRLDELAALNDEQLKQAANKIDTTLNTCHYQTIVHGDAKIANFCFTENADQVAAVDFQYVGGGCGIKDVMLFLSSCLNSDQCKQYEAQLLDYYFTSLKTALAAQEYEIDTDALEQEWRTLYAFAWADFVRFLKGWSPGHWKIHDYSENLTQRVIEQLDKKSPN